MISLLAKFVISAWTYEGKEDLYLKDYTKGRFNRTSSRECEVRVPRGTALSDRGFQLHAL